MSDTLQSRPYRPDPAKACELCCFGTGDHALWCPVPLQWFKEIRESVDFWGERKPDAV